MNRIFSLPAWFIRFYAVKSEIDRLLFLSVAFGSCMLGARILYTGRITYIFLLWNLFLAFIPYVITRWMVDTSAIRNNLWKFVPAFVVWLLFIPNSFYIITDLFHLREYPQAPLWYDLLLILSFAWNGLLMGILSVRQMEKSLPKILRPGNELMFIYPIMWLNALGVYIGRYLRFNSWDIITNPFGLMLDIIDLLIHPFLYKNAWGMVFCFSLFMTLLYLTIKKISKLIW